MKPSSRAWRLITGEYPPQAGGVSDYSRLIAEELSAEGDTVHVYAPPSSAAAGRQRASAVHVHRLPGNFGPNSLRILSQNLGQSRNDPVLVQYVPHAFGFKAMNLAFCFWLYAFGRTNRRVMVMFHEATVPFLDGQPMRHRLLAITTRLMAMLVAKSASVLFVSIPAWKERLAGFAGGKKIEWLPVPSNVAVASDQAAVKAMRERLGGRIIVGHFGSCDPAIEQSLRSALLRLLNALPGLSILLIGMDSNALRHSLVERSPAFAARIHATGALPETAVSIALSSCDLLAQPYPDGVSTRRTSVMAALAHQRAVATTAGVFTEPIWAQTGAVALAPVLDDEGLYSQIYSLAADVKERNRYARAGQRLYEDRFAVRHTIRALRAVACA